MISALADAGAALERADYLDAAVAAAEFLLRDLRDADGRLLRTYNRGRGASCPRYLEDHAFLLEALLTLYEATFDAALVRRGARRSPTTILERFADPERGGFFSTADDHEALIARRKDLEDTPIPSGALGRRLRAAAARRADRRGALRGRGARRASRLLHAIAPAAPAAFGHLLQAIDFHLAAVREVALVGRRPRRRSSAVVRAAFRPHVVLAGGPSATACRCSRAASRSTAAPPPTCASASPASGR